MKGNDDAMFLRQINDWKEVTSNKDIIADLAISDCGKSSITIFFMKDFLSNDNAYERMTAFVKLSGYSL